MATQRHNLLDNFLAVVATTIRRRAWTACGLTTAASLGLVVAGATAATTYTLRGDLWAAIAIAAAGLAITVQVLRTRQHLHRLAETRHRTAHTIAQNRQRLTQSSDRALADDLALRQEILAATELADPDYRGRSATLANAYIRDVCQRLAPCDPGLAAPPLHLRRQAIVLASLGLATAFASGQANLRHGFGLLLHMQDGRPAQPPEPFWSQLTLTFVAPEHTHRSPRVVPNPTGNLRALAGTTVQISLQPLRPLQSLHLVTEPDATQARALTPNDDGTEWRGEFVLRTTTTLRLVADDDAATPTPTWTVDIEPDEPPEVELAPLPRSLGPVSEHDQVDLRFTARDDFGIASATLAIERGEGQVIYLDVGPPPRNTRLWTHRYTWDLSAIPLGERNKLTYWIEVRDNDPDLGSIPLPDPPGKLTRSARMQLELRDEQREHAENVDNLAKLRDSAVDLLAARMQTAEADLRNHDWDSFVQLVYARKLLTRSETLLATMRDLIDALAIDNMVRERDISILTAIHRRLLEIHRREAELHATFPPGREDQRDPSTILPRLTTINRQQVTQLEDEVIRLDDLVDDQVLQEIESLLTGLQAAQQRIVELLEQLQAGDLSVRGELDQLQQRVREDLRRLTDARARLDKEVGSEHINTDAFAAMQRKLEAQDVSEQLRQGDVDGAIQQARRTLDEIQAMRDSVQERQADEARKAEMTPDERMRMQNLRQLSQIQDAQVGLRSDAKSMLQQWRDANRDVPLDPDLARRTAEKAAAVARELEPINDARLGREARRGLEDAREAVAQLRGETTMQAPKALPSLEAAQRAADGVRRALAGAEGDERRRLERARSQLDSVLGPLQATLPPPAPPDASGQDAGSQVEQRQANLRSRLSALLDGPDAAGLNETGRAAIKRASDHMDASFKRLQQGGGAPALEAQGSALRDIQQAIDSLRQQSPPSGTSSRQETSTETERDRSLRDELMDAMREGAPDGFDRAVERYYEELLR